MNCAIVVDVELFTGGVVKEIGMYRNGYCIGFSFAPPFSFSTLKSWDKKQCNWLTKNLHKIRWEAGETPYSYVPFVLDLICEPRCNELLNFSDENWIIFAKCQKHEFNLQDRVAKGFGSIKFYAKGLEKCRLLESIFHHHFIDLDELQCPSAVQLKKQIKDQILCECSSFPVEHGLKMVQHCAQKKAFLYGQWIQSRFNKF